MHTRHSTPHQPRHYGNVGIIIMALIACTLTTVHNTNVGITAMWAFKHTHHSTLHQHRHYGNVGIMALIASTQYTRHSTLHQHRHYGNVGIMAICTATRHCKYTHHSTSHQRRQCGNVHKNSTHNSTLWPSMHYGNTIIKYGNSCKTVQKTCTLWHCMPTVHDDNV